MGTAGAARTGEALGRSEAFLTFQERLSNVAGVNRPVLVVGERGTGKELAARRIHFLSKRWEGPLLTLNCAALPGTLIESELFGYEPGAFTGATRRRRGRFESADGGTLFLDEIGTIAGSTQEKILRVVEYGSFERVGSSESVDVDVRIVGATNADLRQLVAEGQLKPDLLDRLAFEVLVLPPLRDRGGDLALLAIHFAARMAAEMGFSDVPQLSVPALDKLQGYSWPGNIRELKNVVERAVFRSGGGDVGADAVVLDPFPAGPQAVEADASPPPPQAPTDEASLADRVLRPPLRDALRELELLRLRGALHESRHNQREAARLLGLTYNQFRGLYRKHDKPAVET